MDRASNKNDPHTSLPQPERRLGNERRRVTMRSLLLGGLNPRRREGRRLTDATNLLDWHDPKLLALAVTILLLSCMDALITVHLLLLGGEELNPLMAFFLANDVTTFIVAKLILTGVPLLLLVATARARVFGQFRVIWLLQIFLLLYAVLIGYEWILLERTLIPEG